MTKYTARPTKTHLNIDMEIRKNYSIKTRDGYTSFEGILMHSASTIIHFKNMPTNKKSRYLLLMFKGKTFHS